MQSIGFSARICTKSIIDLRNNGMRDNSVIVCGTNCFAKYRCKKKIDLIADLQMQILFLLNTN